MARGRIFEPSQGGMVRVGWKMRVGEWGLWSGSMIWGEREGWERKGWEEEEGERGEGMRDRVSLAEMRGRSLLVGEGEEECVGRGMRGRISPGLWIVVSVAIPVLPSTG